MKTSRLSSLGDAFWSVPRSLLVAGVTLFLGLSTFADTKLVSENSVVKILVPTDGSLGGTWRGVAFNDAAWLTGTNGVGYEVVPGVYSTSVIADSRGEWSAAGRPGENSWINGYYNKTGDADATYQANDFQPFPRSDLPFGPDNFWDGSAWHWFNGNPPWDFIGALDVHPNGNNNAVEHWVIRRWSSTTSGDITLRFHVRKSNGSGGGVTGKVFKNGVEIFTQAIAGANQTGFEAYIHTTAAVGDVFDFAHTPVGPGGDEADGSDGSVMSATVLAGTVTPPAPPVEPAGVADSQADWSTTGVQGANGWTYGFYNATADANGAYDSDTDFNTTDASWAFSGGTWQLGEAGNPGANPPWDTIGQTDWHPNGDNQPQGIHWVVRRWTSDVAGDMYARVRFAKAGAGGNGTTLHVLHKGIEVFTHTVSGTDTVGIDSFVALPGVAIGDRIEFALDPKGSDGLFGDGSDSSTLSAMIFTGAVPEALLANSETDWVTGAQGENNWYYGFYNKTADADGTYNAATDFNRTDPNWTFNGGAWQLGVDGDPLANPPWDTIGQVNWHPNGDNQPQGIHWMVKRWVSEVDGDIQTRVRFGKENIGGGNGTTLRVLHNGNQVYTATVGGTDGTGIDQRVGLPGVFVGDTIDFVLDPLGTDNTSADGADGSFLRATISTGLPPVPPPPFLPGIADLINTDIESIMRGVNPSVFIRIPFDVADPAAIETLRLKIKYNDGFAAYLNGTEIVKRNAPTAIAGTTFADSIADWSTNPDAVNNGWTYGYYSQSLDPDGSYSGTDFQSFPHDGGGASATDFWVGNGYDWFMGNPPWTELFQETTHPNAPNGAVVDPGNPATHVHWTVRRWSATLDANLKARVRFRKTNPNCGDGVRVSVYHNSVQVYSQTIAGNDAVGRDDTLDLPDVFLGDNIDILLGPGDGGNDGCDGSAFSLVIFEGEPSVPWDGAATATRTTTETIAPEILDITSFIPELVAGRNILAIQGINSVTNDNEFVVNAELLANQIPSAVNDTLAASPDTAVDFPASALLANDSDPDGDTLLLVGVTPSYATTEGGTVRLFGNTVRYAPAAGFVGIDTFQYTITDLSGIPVRATATVVVEAEGTVNTPPSFTLATNVLTQTNTLARKIANFVSNVRPGTGASEGNQIVTFTISNNNSNLFTVQPFLNSAGTLIYVASMGSTGSVKVDIIAKDNGGTEMGGSDTSISQSVTINLSVPSVSCPSAQGQAVTTAQNTARSIVLTATGDPGVFSIATPPAHGSLSGAAPNLTYTPATGYCGTDSFAFTASISGCVGSTGLVSITITCPPPTTNQCPVARIAVVPPILETSPEMVFSVTMSGDQERPTPVTSAGAGLGTLTLLGNELTVHVDYLGLSSPVTVGHIHGPATTATAAGVLIGLIPEFGTNGGTSGTISGSRTIPASVAAQMAAGLTYVNIHTVNHGPGEIRGQAIRVQNGKYTLVARNNRNVDLLVEASESFDPDDDNLTYAWYEIALPAGSNGVGGGNHDDEDDENPPPPVTQPVLFGDGLVASRVLWVGDHNIQLRVSDGQCTDHDTVLISVISAEEAVEDCIQLVEDSDLTRKEKRPLIEILERAANDFRRGNANRAVEKLQAFINKAEKLDAEDAAPLIECAQKVIRAVE